MLDYGNFGLRVNHNSSSVTIRFDKSTSSDEFIKKVMLIKGAPKLLSALKRFVEFTTRPEDAFDPEGFPTEELEAVLSDAKNAIAEVEEQ